MFCADLALVLWEGGTEGYSEIWSKKFSELKKKKSRFELCNVLNIIDGWGLGSI
jgi:hypothetical protein